MSFETRAVDGTVTHPMGVDPVGMIMWDSTGRMSAQLGPRERSAGTYVAYFATIDVIDGVEGDLVHHVIGGSHERVMVDQPRHFRFVSDDDLILSPPPADNGSVSTIMWQRLT